MSQYIVKSNISMNGERYEAGDVIELSPEEAAKMPWAVEPLTEELEEEPKPDGDGDQQSGGKKEEEQPPPAGNQPPADPVPFTEGELTYVVALGNFQRNNEEFNKDEVLKVFTKSVDSLEKKGKVRLASEEEVMIAAGAAGGLDEIRAADGR